MIVPLNVNFQIVFFVFLFNFKTQISFYILNDDSNFCIMFQISIHHFNCLDCLETKIMTKNRDINFISSNVKGIQNSLKRLKIFVI